MSKHTAEYLNSGAILIGYASKRGNAWWYRAELDQGEPTHYPEAIPAADIKRRLFGWEPVTGSAKTTFRDGGRSFTLADPKMKTLMRPGTHDFLGWVGEGFKVHSYWKWLVQNFGVILDTPESELGFGSAGLLYNGAVAWAQIEFPETVDGPGGIKHRPFFTAATAMNGSMSSTYQRGSQLVVCDNTFEAAMRENADRVKVAHTRFSLGKLGNVQQALRIMHEGTDAVNAEFEAMLGNTVSDHEWDLFLDAHLGERPREDGRGRTNYDNKRSELGTLYTSDERVAPWKGTEFGVVQAVSTYEHHIATVKGMDRGQRNMDKMIKGEWAKSAARVSKQLAAVQA